jgi:acyl carrier protein
MIPSSFTQLAQMPLTPNGKLDVQALPNPEYGRPILDAEYVQPRSDLEIEIASIWCEVLDLNEIGINDNFFELGGHSLSATQITYQIRQAWNTDLPIRVIFVSGLCISLVQHMLSQSDSQTIKEAWSELNQ